MWNSYELDLVNYQNKCRLIRGWDDLFNKVKEHINSVSAMKLSPYYKVKQEACCAILKEYLNFLVLIDVFLFRLFLQVFEEDALSWEDKLNRIMALFDVWIDVQRRWVYLEGIFTGSADIKHLLPVETQRFQRLFFYSVNQMSNTVNLDQTCSTSCRFFMIFYFFFAQYQHRVLGIDEEGVKVSISDGCAEHSGSSEISGATG